MIIMPSNQTGKAMNRLFQDHHGRLAHLQSADSVREPRFGIPWALDNGVYGAFINGRVWDESPYYEFLDRYAESHSCQWAVVPDWVGDCNLTLEKWHEHAERVASYGVPLALAVQDGMTHDMVRELLKNKNPKLRPSCIFIGGSTEFKLRTMGGWCSEFSHLTTHVARVNTYKRLMQCFRCKCDSVDGTGWGKFGAEKLAELEKFLHETTNNKQRPQLELAI